MKIVFALFCFFLFLTGANMSTTSKPTETAATTRPPPSIRPKCSDPNANRTECGWPCPSTCQKQYEGYCLTKCYVGCECNANFAYDQKSNKCVSECP
ncbi:zonadhesin-like [Anoplophora glabripennis]|uniref:zonadhesin-like n=1 Tax=Anoplophora glabripennis TaxID=217634 RepID=UPI0008746E7D|nr:zonadhesin-like [Anoplophora glabripennis]